MNSVGKHILSEQNTDSSINSIAAQREIYSYGKTLFYAQVIIAIPIPIILSVIKPCLGKTGEDLSWVFALYGIIAAFGEVIFESIVANLKKLAASIQEEFDCKVLSIERNDTLLSAKPTIEDIHRYSMKYKKKHGFSKLRNWYSLEVGKINTNIATLICQRTNCSYDFSIRKKYSFAVIFSAAITFLLILIISSSCGITLPSFILTVLLPSVPVFILAYKQITTNKESADNLENLRTLIEQKLATSKIDTQLENSSLRQIQDKIYYNRILSPLLPDKLYDSFRGELEKEMNFSAGEKVKQLEQQ